MPSCNGLSQSDILNGYIGVHNLVGGGGGGDYLSETHMTCVGRCEIAPPIYEKFTEGKKMHMH
jgi:hypothetical protein